MAAFSPFDAHAGVVTITSLTGSIDPITYTDGQGTFTTGMMTLSLDLSSSSYINFDPSTNDFAMHLVMDVSFNDGKPGGGTDLSGIITQDDVGVAASLGVPFPTTTSGGLSGAGEFDGSTYAGTTQNEWSRFLHILFDWALSMTPPAGITPSSIPLTGEITASFVPEPSSLTLAAIATCALAGYGLRKARV